MKLEYEYTFAEFEAMGYSRNRNKGFYNLRELIYWTLAAFNISFGIAMFYTMINNVGRANISSVFLVILGLGMIFWRFVVAPMYHRWHFGQNMLHGKRVFVDATGSNIKFATDEAATTQKWSAIIKANEEPGHFILWVSKLQAYSIPKSAFEDEKQIQTFRELVASNVTQQDIIK